LQCVLALQCGRDLAEELPGLGIPKGFLVCGAMLVEQKEQLQIAFQLFLALALAPPDIGLALRLAYLAPDLVALFLVQRLEVGLPGVGKLDNRADLLADCGGAKATGLR
jgi:hypothetical protein